MHAAVPRLDLHKQSLIGITNSDKRAAEFILLVHFKGNSGIRMHLRRQLPVGVLEFFLRYVRSHAQ